MLIIQFAPLKFHKKCARNPFCTCTFLVRFGRYDRYTIFDNPVVDICPLRTYNAQKKTEIDLENERRATFLFRVEVPEDAISGTLSLSFMRSLLIFAKPIEKVEIR